MYAAVALWYGGTLNYFDPAEPSVTAVASAFSAGQPLYPALDAPERYVHVWGPGLFLTHAGVMGIFGASIVASKAVGAAAALVSLVLGFAAFRARAGSTVALVASGLCALVYLAFANVSFWTRADPLLLLCVTLGLVGATRRRAVTAALIVGVAMGVAVNLKATGAFYLLPVLVMVAGRHGWRRGFVALGVAMLIAAAPFLLSNVSFFNYINYLRLSATGGPVFQKIRQNLVWAAFLGAPLALLWLRSRRASGVASFDTRALAVLAASMGVIALLGAKPGGGPFHLLPFVPLLAFACVAMWPAGGHRHVTPWLVAFAAVALVFAVRSQTIFIRTTGARDFSGIVEDLRRFANAEPGRRIAVGYAGTSYASYARPEIVFRTHDYWLDAQAIQEHSRAGLPLPPATLRKLADCGTEIWLVPKDGEPFVVPNAYRPDGPPEVFPAEFIDVFRRRYERTGATEFFDVWRCRR